MPRTFHGDAYAALIERLVRARLNTGLTQAEMAIKLGRHQSFVSKYESRIRRLDVVETIIIARMVGLSPLTLVKELGAMVEEGSLV